MLNRIYLDHAATTPMREEALTAYVAAARNQYGNASAVYGTAQEAKRALEKAREVLATSIGATRSEIYFTSGGTESDNWALKGIARSLSHKGKHIITTQIEHHAISATCDDLESLGFEITRLPVNAEGFVSLESVKAAIRPDTILISVMMVNNEIGTIEPIAEIGKIAHEHGILMHTDAVQAYGKLAISVDDMKIDLLSVSAHKLGGPKGIGFLYIRNGMEMRAMIHGGKQERGRRAGTENVPGVISFAAAAEQAMTERESEQERELELQKFFVEGLLEIPEVVLNGPQVGEGRIAGNINVSIRGCDSESVVIMLDLAGIAASGGSACTTGVVESSHVIRALVAAGADTDVKGAVRFSLGRETTREDIEVTICELTRICKSLRARGGH